MALSVVLLAGCAAEVGVHHAGIIGGEITGDFPEVGALLFDGEFLCSAVLVGTREVVTAAHCIYGLENDLAPLAVAFGPNLSQSPPTRGLMSAFVEPDYATNPSRDLAVLTLTDDAPVPPVPWNETALDGVAPPLALTLIGFGDPAFGDDASPRLRRSVGVDLSELTPITLRWNHLDRGTCHGYSGGAAYADLGGGPVLVGVLVEGADDCVGWGSAMRTDVFVDFLSDPAGDSGDDDDATGFGDDDDGIPDPGGCGCSGGGRSGGVFATLLALLITSSRRPRPRPRP